MARVLLVEDELKLGVTLEEGLDRAQYTVDLARDGEEALERLRESRPDLIILDTIMPKLSGWKVTRLVKLDEELRDIPIIMLSATGDVQDKIEGYELGVEDYIPKPFNFSEVLARIRAVLRGRELARAVALKERRITMIESMNKSLIYFARHLKPPVEDILGRAKGLDQSDRSEVRRFVDQVIDYFDEAVAALMGLEDEIAEIESAGAYGESAGIDLADLELKFRKHLELLSSGEPDGSEVRS